MILADIIEYIFLARGFFFISEGTNSSDKKKAKKELFIKSVLYFVNLLMIYESMTVDNKIRKKFLDGLSINIPEVKEEELEGKTTEEKAGQSSHLQRRQTHSLRQELPPPRTRAVR